MRLAGLSNEYEVEPGNRDQFNRFAFVIDFDRDEVDPPPSGTNSSDSSISTTGDIYTDWDVDQLADTL